MQQELQKTISEESRLESTETLVEEQVALMAQIHLIKRQDWVDSMEVTKPVESSSKFQKKKLEICSNNSGKESRKESFSMRSRNLNAMDTLDALHQRTE